MNYNNSLILSVILLSSVVTYSMQLEKSNNNLSMGNFDKLPKDIQKEIFKYIFEDKYLDSLSLDKLKKVLELKLLSKKFRTFIKEAYKKVLRTKEDKLGLELIGSVKNYEPPTGFLSSLLFKDKQLQKITDLIKLGANLDVHDDKLNTVLMIAYNNKHSLEKLFGLLVNFGADINIKDSNGDTFFMKFCKNYPLSKELIEQFFMKKNTKLNLQNNNGETALMITFKMRNFEKFKLLINFMGKADLDLKNNCGETILVVVCKSKESERLKQEIIKLLIKAGADFNLKDSNGNTALIYACFIGNKEIVELLIGSKVDLNLKNNLGFTALSKACDNKKLEIIKLLASAGVDLNLNDNNGYTAIESASLKGNKDVVELLIDYKVDLNLKDVNGATFLFHACLVNNKKLVEFLVDLKVDLDLKDKNGYTALMHVSSQGYKEIAELLIKANAALNLRAMCGQTALMEASRQGNKDIVDLLIKAKASLNLQASNGFTAFCCAVISGSFDSKGVIKSLISAKADLDIKDKYGRTAFMMASISQKKEINKLLFTFDFSSNLDQKKSKRIDTKSIKYKTI